jgi:hypothetical protein
MHVSSERIPKNPARHRVFRHSVILFVWFPDWVVRKSIKRGFGKMTSVVSGTGSSGAQQPADQTPISHLDPYSDRALIHPWPIYAELQDAGPAVWLSMYKLFALARYDSALKALQDPSSFPSSMGVMMNDHMNHVLRGNTLCSDGEDHRRLRRIIMKPLTASALKLLQERVTVEADELVERLVSKGSFCATRELAVHLPVSIVSNEVGLADEGRERMLVWADKMFDCFGPQNDRARHAMPVLEDYKYTFDALANTMLPLRTRCNSRVMRFMSSTMALPRAFVWPWHGRIALPRSFLRTATPTKKVLGTHGLQSGATGSNQLPRIVRQFARA